MTLYEYGLLMEISELSQRILLVDSGVVSMSNENYQELIEQLARAQRKLTQELKE